MYYINNFSGVKKLIKITKAILDLINHQYPKIY